MSVVISDDDIEIIVTNKDLHSSLLIHINILLNLESGIVVKFKTIDRNTVEYSVVDTTTQVELLNRTIFNMDYLINQAWIDTAFVLVCRMRATNEIFPSAVQLEKIKEVFITQAALCYSKCESRYGNSVEDYELTGYDACLVLN